MANFFYLTLDTTAPASPTIQIAGGAVYATSQLVNIALGTGDGTTAGYQMKVWGNVDTAYDTAVQASEGASTWITFVPTKQIKLSTGDGSKTVYYKIRDEVYNESAQASDTISLDTSLPIPTAGTPDVSKVSKITGKNVASFSLSAGTTFTEYKVKVVTATNATHDTGVQIGTANGSSNVAGTGTFSTPITVSINGTDLELASSGDGQKIIKVFIKNSAGTWSA